MKRGHGMLGDPTALEHLGMCMCGWMRTVFLPCVSVKVKCWSCGMPADAILMDGVLVILEEW